MFSRWPISVKLAVGLGLLVAVVASLANSALYTTYAYRRLVKDVSWRAEELPLAAEFLARVGQARDTLTEMRGMRNRGFPHVGLELDPLPLRMMRDQFLGELAEVRRKLNQYRQQLERKLLAGPAIADCQREWATVRKIEARLQAIDEVNRDVDWMLDNVKMERLGSEVSDLERLAAELPSYLHRTLSGFADEVRGQYRWLIGWTWGSSVFAAVIFLLFVKLGYDWVVRPLRMLISGSRQLAAGDFAYQVRVSTADEMAELANAMNQMTARFRAIRDDLDRQVQERTKQVVRNEELASVGFLAAGVAHEINNPLASIALCAESLESRTRGLLDPADADQAVALRYMRMIQSEAFRCKEITEKLLDFSRIGEVKRQPAELGELVQAVIDMVRHLGKYQSKHIELAAGLPVLASVNARQIKQVVLNLLTNALDCSQDDGHVSIAIRAEDGMAVLSVTDDGCGMEPEVLEHVFEPFFTRRKAGQGTGLGLSITYRIVADHGGTIEASSPGPGQGATFRVRLPLVVSQKETSHQRQAA